MKLSEQRILVIDDSATIRRLVDQTLTPAGYRVILAATAEEGLELAAQVQPNMILLDHQLPGTTGTQVCRQILDCADTGDIPVVISSTLRKQAYVEYTDLPNVVDMLPKPYTAELLVTTVENALDTGTLVVQSQSQGTAVPEVIQQAGEADLLGTFNCLSIRELLDFLNNAAKCGTLEVTAATERFFFFLSKGRIVGVSASGLDAHELVACLPDSLRSLEPVLELTVGGRARAELNGIVQLLDRKMVDPRMLRALLTFQAAQLTWRCFTRPLKEFRFVNSAEIPPVHEKVPLNLSLLALLIDAASRCDPNELPGIEEDDLYVRRPVRGQNLDRGGVAAQHMQFLKLLADRCSIDDLAQQLDLPDDEVRQVVCALLMAELVEKQSKHQSRQVVLFDFDPTVNQQMRTALNRTEGRYFGKVVRDRFGLQLVLRRNQPDVLVMALDADGAGDLLRELRAESNAKLPGAKCVGIVPSDTDRTQVLQQLATLGLQLDGLIARPFDAEELFTRLDDVFEPTEALECVGSA